MVYRSQFPHQSSLRCDLEPLFRDLVLFLTFFENYSDVSIANARVNHLQFFSPRMFRERLVTLGVLLAHEEAHIYGSYRDPLHSHGIAS